MKPAKVALGLVLFALLFLGVKHMQSHFIDYPVYSLAAERVLHGHETALYDRGRTTPGGFYYSYFFALAFTPLAFYPPLGKLLLLILLFVSFLKALRFSVPRHARSPYGIALALCGLSLYALNDAFMNANIGILLMAMCLVAYEQAETRPWLAGLSLGAAITFKLYPLLVLCYFVWAKQFKVVAWTALTVFLTLIGAPFFVYGFARGNALLADQFYVLSHFGSHWRYDSLVFQNFPATIMRYVEYLGGNPDYAFLPAVALCLMALLLLYTKSFLQTSPPPPDLKQGLFFLVLAAMPFIGPVTWYNMALFYLPILGYFVSEIFESRLPRPWFAVLAFALLFCLTTPDILGRSLNDRLEYFAVPFWGEFILVLSFIVDTTQRFPAHFYLVGQPTRSGAT